MTSRDVEITQHLEACGFSDDEIREIIEDAGLHPWMLDILAMDLWIWYDGGMQDERLSETQTDAPDAERQHLSGPLQQESSQGLRDNLGWDQADDRQGRIPAVLSLGLEDVVPPRIQSDELAVDGHDLRIVPSLGRAGMTMNQQSFFDDGPAAFQDLPLFSGTPVTAPPPKRPLMKTRIGEPAKYIYFTPERMVDGRNWRYAIFTTAKGEQLRRFQFWADKGWADESMFPGYAENGLPAEVEALFYDNMQTILTMGG